MKLLKPLLPLSLLGIWVLLLSFPMGDLPPLGKFLSPATGFWSNATAIKKPIEDFQPFQSDAVLKRVKLVFDERVVPHIKAENEYDLYYTQGYVQAYYRLWQMDMQTRAAAGRISEVVGEKALNFDREQRRKGMLWGAENSLEMMMKDPQTQKIVTAYTDGVNAFINSLNYKNLPIEFKLMNYRPEEWKPLNTALLMMAMANDLTGYSTDLPLSYVRQFLSDEEFELLYPDKLSTSMPVIPAGTAFDKSSLVKPEVNGANLFAQMPKGNSVSSIVYEEETGIGSNNWVLSGKKTKSGNPILANDPHLGLNLPSIWFEMQLTAPGLNCYGVSIPGAPGIIIGFNEKIAWGMTNNYRDVKDYYALKTNENTYLFDGVQRSLDVREEKIFIKGKQEPYVDKVKYSIHGPVIYEPNFPDPARSGMTLALTWTAHRATNEAMAVIKLNKAQNYQEFVAAIHHFEVPGQNFIYGDVEGNIAIWGQGRFINKWKNQGRFVMRGDTSATLWQEDIPMAENPHAFNPKQGYLESANQQVTDNTYPYYYNGNFSEFRSWAIHHFLDREEEFTISELQDLQSNTWSLIASKLQTVFRQYGAEFGEKYPNYFEAWNDSLMAESKTGLAFDIWWSNFYKNFWEDKFRELPLKIFPSREVTIDLLLNHPDILESVSDQKIDLVASKSFSETEDSLKVLIAEGKGYWYQAKNTSLTHLAKLASFSFEGLKTGGSGTTINAMQKDYGPSWRMVIEMGKGGPQGFCVYPGGQSGNPGSVYYNSFVDKWIKGNYSKIHFFDDAAYNAAKEKAASDQ